MVDVSAKNIFGNLNASPEASVNHRGENLIDGTELPQEETDGSNPKRQRNASFNSERQNLFSTCHFYIASLNY